MSQSNFVALFIFAAFIVFITLRGELSKYLALLIPTGATNAANTTAATAIDPAKKIADVASTVTKLAVLL